MAEQWYYQLFGQEYGPVDLDVVIQKFNSGELGIRDLVRKGTRGKWVKYSAMSTLTEDSQVAVETADIATDIDSFMLVDEKEMNQPQVADDIDSFLLIEEKTARQHGHATDLDEFSVDDDEEVVVASSGGQNEAATDYDTPIWYFQTLGQELGPVPLSELVSMVEQSELQPDDLIRMGARGQWVPAGDIDGLFPDTPQRPTAPAPAPRAAAPVARGNSGQFAAPVLQPPRPVAPAPPVVETGWYCYINEQEYGPISITDLQSAAVNGQIFPASYVKHGAQGEWVLASQISNLFPAPPVAAPSPPASSPSISKVQLVPSTDPVSSASMPTMQVSLADTERNELVQQLLSLLKQGLSEEMMGGGASVAPLVGGGWYCNISGSVIGPVSIESLVQMVLQKRLFPDDLIRMGPTGEWFPASSVPDLFPSSPGAKGKKSGLDDAESVMARIDRMYREGQEAQAKAEAANPGGAAAPKTETKRANFAGDALKSINSNIARGATAEGQAARAKAAAGGGGDSLGEQLAALGIKNDAKTYAVLGVLVLGVVGYFVAPGLMKGAATSSALKKLVTIHAKVTENEGADATAWAKQAKELGKELDAINKTLKGGASGSAQRDVGRMGKALKDMVDGIGKPKPTDGSPSPYEQASKQYDDYFKAARKKMGLK